MANDLLLEPHDDVSNPVLSADDVSDIDGAKFVADPFYVYNDDMHYIFFEILNRDDKGVIGYATSTDGRDWSYQGVVLEEPFHLAFPYIFSYESEWYLSPDYLSGDDEQPLRIYKARTFPTDWTLYKTFLTQKKNVDPVIIPWNGLWYIFVHNQKIGVNLYFSDDLKSNSWHSHPENPITDTRSMWRMAGRPFIDQGLHLFFQDGRRYLYGEKVRCCRVDILDENNYTHSEIPTSPIVRGQFNGGWNHQGMHHVDLSPYIDHEQDFVLVDGCDINQNWSIGIYQISDDDSGLQHLSRSQKVRRYSTIAKTNAHNIWDIVHKK